MSKFLKTLLTVLLVATFAFFALGSGESTDSQPSENNNAEAEKVETTAAEETTLGNYEVEIKSCRLAKDYEGKDVVIVNYGFTNNADDPAAFYVAFDDAVYQDGVGLNEAYVLSDNAKYNSDNQTKEIKKGASLDVEVAYELNDLTTEIEVEVKELFSFDDSSITKTFSLE